MFTYVYLSQGWRGITWPEMNSGDEMDQFDTKKFISEKNLEAWLRLNLKPANFFILGTMAFTTNEIAQTSVLRMSHGQIDPGWPFYSPTGNCSGKKY